MIGSVDQRNLGATRILSRSQPRKLSQLQNYGQLTYQWTQVRRTIIRKHTVRPFVLRSVVFTFLLKSFDSQLELVTHAYETMKWKGVSMLMEF